MSKSLMNYSLNKTSRSIYFVVGATLIAAVLFMPAVPPWIAALGAIPILSALMRWSPVEAAISKINETFSQKSFRFYSSQGRSTHYA